MCNIGEYDLFINNFHSLRPSDALGTWILIYIGSGDGLPHDSTKPLYTWTNVDLSTMKSCGSQLTMISEKMLKVRIIKMRLELPHFLFQPHLPWPNALTHWLLGDFNEILDK